MVRRGSTVRVRHWALCFCRQFLLDRSGSGLRYVEMHRAIQLVAMASALALVGCGGHGRPTHAESGMASPRTSAAPVSREVAGRGIWHASSSAPCWPIDYRWTQQVQREIATVPRGRGMPSGTGCHRFTHHGSTSHWRLTYWDQKGELGRCLLVVH